MSKHRASRTADAIVGTVFLILGVAILLTAWQFTPPGAAIAAALVGGLGIEAIVSAVRSKASLISRIGPLP